MFYFCVCYTWNEKSFLCSFSFALFKSTFAERRVKLTKTAWTTVALFKRSSHDTRAVTRAVNLHLFKSFSHYYNYSNNNNYYNYYLSSLFFSLDNTIIIPILNFAHVFVSHLRYKGGTANTDLIRFYGMSGYNNSQSKHHVMKQMTAKKKH